MPSPRRRSARPFRRPAASARSLSRFSSRSRSSLFRWFLAAAPRIFLYPPSPDFAPASPSSSELRSCGGVLPFDGEDEEPEPVRCRFVSSVRLKVE